ncbi:hypothetical protein H4S04_001159 [Coemansia sp. S16]|nr:hypothetical protein H4S04_001159 [Coemansia sp. S16]
MISNLTHISCTSEFANGNAYQFIQLAQRNALTLQSLDIECGDAIDVLGLVQDADDNHVSYPCLLILKLKAWLHTQEARRPAFRGAAPFPILQQLLLSFDCQFDDDTFFRGNSATLKVLDMWLDSASISMLWKYKVFVPGSHPKLQVVRLWYAGTIEPVFTSIADALQFINDIGSGAAVREYKGISFHAYLVGIPSSLDSHTCIQVLSLPNFGPDVWQVITLIKSLPLLSDLSTSLPSRGDIPEGVTFDTLPEHIVSNYAPIGRRFRCWHLNKGHDNYCNDPLTCVLLLALACPNFDYADSAIGRDGLFMEMMEGEIYSVRFKPYAPRLRRLLFRGDDDDCDSDYNSTSDDYDSWESESDNTDGDSLESDRDSDDSRETDSDDDRETDGDNDYTPDTTANIATFVQRVKQMAPTVRKIEEIPYARANNLLKRRDVHIIDLVQQLFGIVEKHTVVAYGRDLTVGCLDLESTRDLVRIQYFMDQSADAAMQLIHSNVRTLQHLDLDVGEADVTGLVRDPNGGGYLEYPCLHTLKIYSVYDRVLSEEAIFKDIVPFPRLSRLSVWPYLFGDNVLFRGNSATFEYLEVELIQETVSMLRKCRIFTPTSHPNLKCVKIRLPLFDIPRAFVTAAEYTQFVLSIAPGASVRKISGLTKYPEDRTPALSMLKDHGCIQILSLPDTSLSLWDVISLVKSLPFLSDLHTQPMSGSELPQDISMDTLPGYIRATYGSIGRRFRCWHIETEWRTELNYVEAATFILLLALVFPNFDYAAIDKTHCIPFMSAMKKKIADPEFSQDAPRLSRLLFNGWNDC